jgi:hypothetical protein
LEIVRDAVGCLLGVAAVGVLFPCMVWLLSSETLTGSTVLGFVAAIIGMVVGLLFLFGGAFHAIRKNMAIIRSRR